MRFVAAASVVVGRLACVAYCTRLHLGQDVWEPSKELLGASAPSDRGSVVGVPPRLGAPLDADVPRRPKRTRMSRLRNALGMLLGASAEAGASVFGAAGGQGLPRLPRSSEVAYVASDVGQGRALPTALALRGGSDIIEEREEPPLDYEPDHELSTSAGEDPEFQSGQWFSDELTSEESQALLLKGAWQTFFQDSRQMLWFEFGFHDGMHAEITWYDLPDIDRKVGSELVLLSPVIVAGRFLGFAGSSGLLNYRMSHAGDSLRIDFQHGGLEMDSLWSDHFTRLAAPVSKRGEGVSPSSPSTEFLQERLLRTMRAIARAYDPEDDMKFEDTQENEMLRTSEIASLLRQPGYWTGHAGGILPALWEFRFFENGFWVECAVTLKVRGKSKKTDVVKLLPVLTEYDDLRGEGTEVTGYSTMHIRGDRTGSDAYKFTADDSGRLQVDFVYTHIDSGDVSVSMRHRLLLDYTPSMGPDDGGWTPKFFRAAHLVTGDADEVVGDADEVSGEGGEVIGDADEEVGDADALSGDAGEVVGDADDAVGE